LKLLLGNNFRNQSLTLSDKHTVAVPRAEDAGSVAAAVKKMTTHPGLEVTPVLGGRRVGV
jgi:hypothetical protein